MQVGQLGCQVPRSITMVEDGLGQVRATTKRIGAMLCRNSCRSWFLLVSGQLRNAHSCCTSRRLWWCWLWVRLLTLRRLRNTKWLRRWLQKSGSCHRASFGVEMLCALVKASAGGDKGSYRAWPIGCYSGENVLLSQTLQQAVHLLSITELYRYWCKVSPRD